MIWLQINHRDRFATGHADGRESVEIFEIELDREEKPLALWRGAVPIPEWAFGNDVCALLDGGFALTSTYFVGAAGLDMAFRGEPSGHVLEWRGDPKLWRIVPGTDVNAPNGIALSADGDSYFVVSWATKQLHKISRSRPRNRQSIDASVLRDNLTWTNTGHLLLTGQKSDARTVRRAIENDAKKSAPFDVIRIDPATLSTETVLTESLSYCFASTALGIDDEIWISAVHGTNLFAYH